MRKNVLVVEDDLLVRLTVCYYLEDMGWKVRDVESGRAALEVFGDRTTIVDAVLADLHLPDMDGAELARMAQVDSPFIFMSGALEVPTNLPGPVLLKPFDEKALELMLAKVWEEREP